VALPLYFPGLCLLGNLAEPSRQGDRAPKTSTLSVSQQHIPTERTHDPPGNAQAETRSFDVHIGVKPAKSPERLFMEMIRDAWAIIVDVNLHAVLRLRKVDSGASTVFAGVLYQIAQHPTQGEGLRMHAQVRRFSDGNIVSQISEIITHALDERREIEPLWCLGIPWSGNIVIILTGISAPTGLPAITYSKPKLMQRDAGTVVVLSILLSFVTTSQGRSDGVLP
jgi:hypothetical protein